VQEKGVEGHSAYSVINYRVEMIVGDSLKFLLLYVFEMTPYVFFQ